MNAKTTATRGRTARKLIGSLGIVGTAAAVAGVGTFGTFTDSTAPLDASVTSGTVELTLTTTNSTASLPLTGTNFVPGDSMARSVDLTNAGTAGLSGLQLTTTATTSSILDTDRTNGLQLKVESCSANWTETINAGVPSYTCPGTRQALVPSAAAIGGFSLANAASLTAGGTDHLVISLTLPTSAGNDFQGKYTVLSLTFTGIQATGTAR